MLEADLVDDGAALVLERGSERLLERLALDEQEDRLVVFAADETFSQTVGRPLSRGTLDQIYLALRLAIIDHLDADRERLPVFLDEVFVKINGERHYLWRAVDHEGEVLESFVTKTRDKKAALKFLRKAMRKHGQPEVIVTDRLLSYGAALKETGAAARQETGRWLNNRVENSPLPFRRRERAMLRFRRVRSLQKFAAVHASVYNLFNSERSLTSRAFSS